ncbi:hypothetical protein ACSZOB_15475, partial [Aeromonas veronii]
AQYGAGRLHAETALGTGRMTSTFECSKKWGDYHCSLYQRILWGFARGLTAVAESAQIDKTENN